MVRVGVGGGRAVWFGLPVNDDANCHLTLRVLDEQWQASLDPFEFIWPDSLRADHRLASPAAQSR